MPDVEFEPTITASERAKTFHALDRSATGLFLFYIYFIWSSSPGSCVMIVYIDGHGRTRYSYVVVLWYPGVVFKVRAFVQDKLKLTHERLGMRTRIVTGTTSI
jgi:hypothetical protein